MDGDGGGEDHLSSLPDDVLRLILLRLRSTAAAGRTSLLSRRWRHLWAHLPVLIFPTTIDTVRVRSALAAYAAPAFRHLHVSTHDAAPDATAAVLLLAAPRLTGELHWFNSTPWDDEEEEKEAFELPCFEKAAQICLSLGSLGLTLPPSGVFAQLADLSLHDVRFDGRCDLGDAVSSARCPLLQYLLINNAQGLSNLAIHSESLLHVELRNLHGGFRQLTIVAPKLKVLDVEYCFIWRKPFADISCPVLENLRWADAYHPTSVHFREMERLQGLSTLDIMVYGQYGYEYHWDSVMLLRRFEAISTLELLLAYPIVMLGCQYLMEAITMLPVIEILSLELTTEGHAFGPCIFHLLRMSTGIRKLDLTLCGGSKARAACSSGCICNQPQDWETEDIFLNFLQEVEINESRGAEHEFAFLKRLLRWAAVLKTVTVRFRPKLAVSEELCRKLISLCSPYSTCVKIYYYHNGCMVLYAPVN